MRPDRAWVTRATRTAVLTSVLLVACGKAKVGGPCSAGQVACLDAHTGLFCVADHLVTMTCMGPAGCQSLARGDVACDNPTANAGDGCNQPKDTACSVDKTAALVCTGEKFVLAQPCKGPRGCIVTGETVYCDNALAEPGDACTEEGDAACKSDRSAFMKCVRGKFAITSACRGPKRCTVTEKPDENKEHFECDDSLSQIDDPCEEEGEQSCSVDKKTLDVCKARKVVLGKACPGSGGCAWNAARSHFDCDTRKR